MSAYITTLQPSQVDELLELQRANLIQHLSAEDIPKQGFLTFQYSSDLIKEMMQHMPQPIAVKNGKIVGYALATAKSVCENDTLLRPLITVCDRLQYREQPLAVQNYYSMGQICVAHNSRGEGIFDKLYQKHKEQFQLDYDLVVTEISNLNLRSQAAHKRVGFHTLHQYEQDQTLWNVVVWDFDKGSF